MEEKEEVIDRQPQSVEKTVDADDSDLSDAIPRVSLPTDAEKPVPETAPGLGVLKRLNKLEVVQRLDTLEVCLGWTRNNRYCIYNEEGEQIFYVYEASVCFDRQLTGALRGLVLKMSVSDDDQEDALMLRRPGACSTRCCWACCNLQHMEVLLPSGSLLANVREVWSCCIPHYQLTDSKGEGLWRVRGGACHCRCCCLLHFQFLSTVDGKEAATVTRACQGCKELIGAANRFTIQFSENLTSTEKLIILGSSFLIDLNYFEKQNKCW